MSIEDSLSRIAVALEKLTTSATLAVPANTAAPASTAAPADTAPALMTLEELNAGMVEEFKRLGGREKIDAVMQAAPFGVRGATELTAEQYAPLLAAIKAVV